MANPPVLFPLTLPPKQPERDQTKEISGELLSLAATIGNACLAFCNWLEDTARKAQQDHLRGARLAAYRARHRWKAGDVRPLLSIGVNEAAQRRMVGLKGRGRPVVQPHRPLEDMLREKLTICSYLFREDATSDERRRSFKAWPWWKQHVEALYRGELEMARAKQVKEAHAHAERAVADALRMSQGKVHAICGEIRAVRRKDAEAADFPPMMLVEYEDWMEQGRLSKRLEVDAFDEGLTFT